MEDRLRNQPRILLINDMAGYGKVALSVMIPVFSHMKYETFNLPTVLISNTLDYGNFDILDTTEYMQNTLRVWNELQFSFDAICTGFIVSERQGIELFAPATSYIKALQELGIIVIPSNQELATAFQRNDFTTSIKFSIDSYIRRVCSKTVFNFMCKKHSAEYMLDPKFDLLRDYIRNGKWDEALWFRYSTGFVSAAVPPNETAHMIGTMIFNNNGHWELLGCVTWFGEITYIMKVCDLDPVEEHDVGNGLKAVIVPAIDTHVAYFDNENQKIIEENVTLIYGGR